MTTEPFRFRQFEVFHDQCAMKVGTDAVLLGAWANVSGANAILDIGTGSGVVALMTAQRNQKALIDAVEIDEKSWLQCEENFKNSPWPERLTAFHSDIKNFQTKIKYNVVISNPPFFSDSLLSGDEVKDKARHSVSLTLKELAEVSAALLNENGRMCFILPADQETEIKNLAAVYGFYAERICSLRYNPDKPVKRVLIEFVRDAGKAVEQILCIRNSKNEFTAEFAALTENFYPCLLRK